MTARSGPSLARSARPRPSKSVTLTPAQWEAWAELARRLGVGDGRGGVSAAMARVVGVGVEALAGVVEGE